MQSSRFEVLSLPDFFFFIFFYFPGEVLEKFACELNSFRGAVLYCAGCRIIGVLSGNGYDSTKSPAVRDFESNCRPAESRWCFDADFDIVPFLSLSVFPNYSYLIERSMDILFTPSEIKRTKANKKKKHKKTQTKPKHNLKL